MSLIDLNATRRVLFGANHFLVDHWELRANSMHVRGWALSGYEDIATFSFRANGREPKKQRMGLSSPSLKKVFPFVPSSGNAGFELILDVADADRERGYIELSLCDGLLGEPMNMWHDTFLPPNLDASPLPSAEQLERTQGNTSSARYLAYGLTTMMKIERLLKIYVRKGVCDFSRVLDWGAGCGRITRHLLNRCHEVTGCDIDRENVDWCNANLRGRFIQTELLPPLPFGESSFDLIIGISVFTHLTEDAAIAWRDELLRVLAPEGIAIITVHGKTGIARILDDDRMRRAARDDFESGMSDKSLNSHISDPQYYRATYQSPASARRFFGDRFVFVDQICGANALWQDFIVLQKPTEKFSIARDRAHVQARDENRVMR